MIREYHDLGDLAQLRPAWHRLLSQTPGATFFQTCEWLATYWRHHGAGQRLRVLVWEEGGEAQGILPLCVKGESTRVGRVRTLCYPLDGWGSFYGPIGPRPVETLREGFAYLAGAARDWEMIDLRWSRPGDGSFPPRHSEDEGFHTTAEAMRSAGFSAESRVWGLSGQIDLSSGWETYWESRKGHMRANVRRSHRKLSGRGEVQLVRHRPQGEAAGDADPRWDLYEQCEQIAAHSWQGSSETGTTLSHESVKAFLRDAHHEACKSGMADLCLLYAGGRPAAFAYNYCFQGRLYSLRMGYDSEFAQQGAGSVMLATMLEDSCLRGDSWMDQGEGSLEYKRQWQSCVAESWSHCHYPTWAPRAQALRIRRWLTKDARQPAAYLD